MVSVCHRGMHYCADHYIVERNKEDLLIYTKRNTQSAALYIHCEFKHSYVLTRWVFDTNIITEQATKALL